MILLLSLYASIRDCGTNAREMSHLCCQGIRCYRDTDQAIVVLTAQLSPVSPREVYHTLLHLISFNDACL